MKSKSIISALILFGSTLFAAGSCSKKTDDTDCKTCRAFSVDGVVDEQEVCSEAEEAAFRNDNPGREISCQ